MITRDELGNIVSWHYVADHLPEHNDEVLCYSHGKTFKASFQSDDAGNYFIISDKVYFPSHWAYEASL